MKIPSHKYGVVFLVALEALVACLCVWACFELPGLWSLIPASLFPFFVAGAVVIGYPLLPEKTVLEYKIGKNLYFIPRSKLSVRVGLFMLPYVIVLVPLFIAFTAFALLDMTVNHPADLIPALTNLSIKSVAKSASNLWKVLQLIPLLLFAPIFLWFMYKGLKGLLKRLRRANDGIHIGPRGLLMGGVHERAIPWSEIQRAEVRWVHDWPVIELIGPKLLSPKALPAAWLLQKKFRIHKDGKGMPLDLNHTRVKHDELTDLINKFARGVATE